jgi:hypothetical protein
MIPKRSIAAMLHGDMNAKQRSADFCKLDAPRKRPDWMRWVVLVCLMTLTAGKLVLIASLDSPVPQHDAGAYLKLGRMAAAGDVWLTGQPIAYRTPVYPWVLAIVIRVLDADQQSIVHAMLWLQSILRWLTILVAGSLAAKLYQFSKRAQESFGQDGRFAKFGSSWLSVAVWAICLPAISAPTYVHVLLTETWFTLCLMIHLWCVVHHADRPSLGSAIAVAVTFVLTLLTRPIVMLLWIAHVIFWTLCWWRQRPATSVKRRVTGSFLMLVTILVLLTPWWLRNYQMFGEAFVTKFVGRNVWIVTFQPGSGAGLAIQDNDESRSLLQAFALTPESANALPMQEALLSWRHTWTTHKKLKATGMADPDIDDAMKQVAKDAALANPVAFARKSIRRIANFWRTAATDLPVGTNPNVQLPDDARWMQRLASIWIDLRLSSHVWINTLIAAVMASAIAGLLIVRRTRLIGIWLGMILAYFTIVTGVLEIPDYRYRMVLEPLVAVVMALALPLLPGVEKWLQHRSASSSLPESMS